MPRPFAQRALLGVVFSLTLPACTFVSVAAGEHLPARSLASLEPGVSTQADVIRELGPPGDVGHLRFATVFVYRLTLESVQALEISVQVASAGYQEEDRRFGALAVFFDRKGVLTGWGLSQPQGG